MSRPAIEVQNLSKKYQLGVVGATTLRADLARLARRWRGEEPELPADEFWALRDVSFQIGAGEVVGIIGRNGAGKSTLLKILSRITEPTMGRALLRGRVASLLEVGTGFQEDLTGRENVFLNGAILGMKRAEVAARFDEILAFAEVEKFIDTPVKHYSSGMRVRLAFAVAAHLQSEILIVDEVLAVGDAAFQKKCLGKIGEVAGRSGRTVLFVSHNMVAVQSLCQRVIIMQGGRNVGDGPPAVEIAQYIKGLHEQIAAAEWTTPATAPGGDTVRLKRVRIRPASAAAGDPLTMQTPFLIEVDFWAFGGSRQAHLTFHLINEQGVVVLTTGSPTKLHAAGLHRATCHVPGLLLNSGDYTLKLLVIENGNQLAYANEEIASFTVHDPLERTSAWLGREPGVVQPVLRWDVTPQDGSTES